MDDTYVYMPVEAMEDATGTMHLTKVFDRRAVFSDGTCYYRRPAEPQPGDTVTVRLRTARGNASTVVLVTDEERQQLNVIESDALFDFYEGSFTVGKKNISYYFIIWCDEDYYYYNQLGLSNDLQTDYSFIIMPGFSTPEWAKGAVMYQIFADRFCNGNDNCSVMSDEYNYINGHTVRVYDWNKYPDKDGVTEFYGGDLAGVKKKLNYLQELGIEVLYMNPLFISPSNHKYDTQDYDYIDPHFTTIPYDEGELLAAGDTDNSHAARYINRVTDKRNLEASNRYFAEFVEEVHKRGMKLILDGVFNHCGSFNKWMDRQLIYEKVSGYDKGAYVDKNSPYNSFFKFSRDAWPYNDSYDGWWGYSTLPKLNYEESPILFEYIMHIARKWVSPPYNVDGWRLDVAADLGHSKKYNHNFWKAFRRIVKDANPNALILAENYDNSREWLQGDEWDSIMNYEAFMEPVTWFLTGMEKHSDKYQGELHNNSDVFFCTMAYNMTRMNCQTLQTAMNELSNHDHSRFLTRTNGKVGRTSNLGAKAAEQDVNVAIMREAVMIQMTWPGAPTVYYGDEAGLCGWTDPDNRRAYPWGREDTELVRYHRELIQLHRAYDALKIGSIKFLSGKRGVICYGRFTPDERFVIAVNNNSYEEDISIPIWEIGARDGEPMIRMVHTTCEGFDFEASMYRAEHGVLRVRMKPFSAMVLKNLPPYLR